MKIGVTELVVVFLVALFVIGPDKLPEYARKLGEALAQFRRYSDAAAKEIKESIVEPLEEAQAPLQEAIKPLNDLDQAVRDNVKDVKDSLAGVGRPKKQDRKPQEEPAAGTPDEEAAGAETPMPADLENTEKEETAE